MNFERLVEQIEDIGHDWHFARIIENSKLNSARIAKTIRNISRPTGDKARSAIVVNAGPSLHHNNTLSVLAESGYSGTIIAIDGSYVKCLKAGIIPDFVITLDPHATRMVRWFGDPDFEQNLAGDDYFSRQDLDVDFRENSLRQNQENIDLVNKHARESRLVVASTSPANMVARATEAGFDMYWWMPLVDDPTSETSLTRKIYQITNLPALNTGGNVGTSAWVFARFWLQIEKVGLVGTDLGYRLETPYSQTQTYPELLDLLGEDQLTPEYFPETVYPGTGETFYSDPTYTWYRRNLLDLIRSSGTAVYNCTEGGTLCGEGVECVPLKSFIELTQYG